MNGTYIGEVDRLKGKTALLRFLENELPECAVEAQFDDPELPESQGWTQYPRSDWKVDE